jgi:predicted nucleic acid-binding Zn ribbon protein
MLTDDKKQANVQVDLTQADTVLCEKCSNGLFIQSFFLKKVSRLVSPTGQEAVIPVQVYSCGNCGHINTKLNPTAQLGEETTSSN